MTKTEPLPNLTPDEVDEYESSEAGEWISMGDVAKHRAEAEALVRNTLRDQRHTISVSISAFDLTRLSRKADEKGVGTDALIDDILHQAANA
jgi:predicted DNA binding CopG/RHH family protein